MIPTQFAIKDGGTGYIGRDTETMFVVIGHLKASVVIA